ncbi:hypothetical protein AAFF_G00025400 [Aldrovandia affinis]|uniref:Uncharacterized protein n=1 Tax=Aldrovandia affinis TaxID=143900 RepID=A0AAD7S4Y1_9TELE|nr:hypothetical protein AAFF_G00025400 [Aldrovandia affinis]
MKSGYARNASQCRKESGSANDTVAGPQWGCPAPVTDSRLGGKATAEDCVAGRREPPAGFHRRRCLVHHFPTKVESPLWRQGGPSCPLFLPFCLSTLTGTAPSYKEGITIAMGPCE